MSLNDVWLACDRLVGKGILSDKRSQFGDESIFGISNIESVSEIWGTQEMKVGC